VKALVEILVPNSNGVGVSIRGLQFTDNPPSGGPTFIISDQSAGKCYYDQSVALYPFG
jgi:hypothetical protein